MSRPDSRPCSLSRPAGPVDVIAVDGPSGAGKSTVARRLAEQLGWAYLDTGAMYRAVTWLLLERDWFPDPADPAADSRLVARLADLELLVDGDGRVHVDGRDVTAELRSARVEARVSEVAALVPVRHRMAGLQRQIGSAQRLVAEGRDMGSRVFPQARFKFYLDAALDTRAERRLADFRSGGREISLDEVRAGLAHRDRIDSSRSEAPLVQADGAERVDTTALSIEAVVDKLASIVRAAIAERAPEDSA